MPALLISLLALLLPAAAPAVDCGPVRLDQEDGTLAKIPVTDQDGLGICYAYVAAQMADAHRHRRYLLGELSGEFTPEESRRQRTHRTSPLPLAATYNRDRGKAELEIGYIKDAILQLHQDGSCSHQRVGDRFGAYDIGGFVKELRSYFRLRRAAPALRAEALGCFLADHQLAGRPAGQRGGNLQELVNVLAKPQFTDYLAGTLDLACRGHVEKLGPPPSVDEHWGFREADGKARRERFREDLHSLTAPSSLPVGIYYCRDVLEKGQPVGVGANGRPKDSCTHHNSLVIGKRPGKNGQCQWLVRNFEGASCEGYDRWPCERGQYWVDEEALLANLTATVVMP